LPFRNHYARLYADAQAMGVRRLVDRSHDLRSLARLLVEIQLHRDVLTVDRYLDGATGRDADHARRTFDQLFGRGHEHVCDEVLDEDLERIDLAAKPVVYRASKVVAHMTEAPPRAMTFADIHRRSR
jgi:hypothetical protein